MSSSGFSLQPVLNVRQAAVERARVALCEAERTEADLHRQRAELLEALQRVQIQRRRILSHPGGLDVALLKACSLQEQHIKAQSDALQCRWQDARGLVTSCRDLLTRAHRDVRTLERLSEKQAAESLQQQRSSQQRQSQELATHR